VVLPAPPRNGDDDDDDPDDHDDDHLEKIPAMVSELARDPDTEAAIVLGTGDFRSAVTAMQFYDKGYDVVRYDLISVLDDPSRLSVMRGVRKYPVVAVTPVSKRRGDGIEIIPRLKEHRFREYRLPRPVKLPGGVTTKEFAKTWIDNGDWPVWVRAPGRYGAPVNLAKP